MSGDGRTEGERLAALEARLDGFENLITILAHEREAAQNKFEVTVERGFVKQNEFRGSLDDLGRQMATRRESEAAIAALSTRVDATIGSVTARIDEQSRMLAELRSRIDVGPQGLRTLQSGADRHEGRQAGIGASVGWLVAAAGFVATILGIVVILANVLTSP